jgi:hypothetical protein
MRARHQRRGVLGGGGRRLGHHQIVAQQQTQQRIRIAPPLADHLAPATIGSTQPFTARSSAASSTEGTSAANALA